MPIRMTVDELMNHAHKCFLMMQYFIFLNALTPTSESEKEIRAWHKAGKRAEYRADCIDCGKEDPAFTKTAHNH